jgi:hexosaminidase
MTPVTGFHWVRKVTTNAIRYAIKIVCHSHAIFCCLFTFQLCKSLSFFAKVKLLLAARLQPFIVMLKNTLKHSVAFTLLFLSCLIVRAQEIAIIPEPVSLKAGQGTFALTAASDISIPNGQSEISKIAVYLLNKVKASTGFDLKVAAASRGVIQLELLVRQDAKLGQEGYLLDVTPTNVVIKANSPAGIFYGVQSFLQLLPKEIESDKVVQNVTWTAPAVSVIDYPRFGWRGLMLDVSRHFFPKEYIKEYLDQMARYKFNRFHWHLTDDNGWRIEIKSLPKLTEVGAWRVPRTGYFGTNEAPNEGEKPTYGGFYTQEEIKDIIQYAKDRFIEVLPEIDVPGHSMAVNASYPELSVTRDPNIKVNPGSSFSKWFGNGKFEMYIDNTLDPTDEDTYQFLDKVFGEVATLFPFEYIHMGGDECYKGYWERDARVQAFMKKNNLKDGDQLQNYFVKRVSKIVNGKKKKLMGWDEILEGGVPPQGAAVMSWRGVKGGIEASHQKHAVVMSPSPIYYLDMMQGDPAVEVHVYNTARLKDVYAFDIIVPEIDSTYVLGGQGNLWTEQISTTAQAEYMNYPRALAISETMWTPKSKKNWDSFFGKVETHFGRFDAAGINYAQSVYDPIISVKKNDAGRIVITLATEIEGIDLYYTVDNSIPNHYHPKYISAIEFPEGADNFRVIAYRDGKPAGRLISIKAEDLEKRVKK